MKKITKPLSIFLCLVLAAFVCVPAFAQNDRIGVYAAADIALSKVGLTYEQFESERMIEYLSDVTMRERFNGGRIESYYVCYIYRGVRYEYAFELDGAIRSESSQSVLPGSTGDMSRDAAKQTAVAYVGYPDEVSRGKSWRVKSYEADGRSMYKVSFLFDADSSRVSEPNAIYEFKYTLDIDCATGEVVSAQAEDNSSSFANRITAFFNRIIIVIWQIFGVFA